MKKYKGEGISEYEISEDSILIKWTNGNFNTFNYDNTHEKHLDKMKELAEAGKDLTKYYNENVKKYNRK